LPGWARDLPLDRFTTTGWVERIYLQFLPPLYGSIAGNAAEAHIAAMNDNFDYAATAELFPASGSRKGAVSYHRFNTLAEALRFAVEELSPELLPGAFIESEEVRYGPGEIRSLYDAPGYPLSRQQ